MEMQHGKGMSWHAQLQATAFMSRQAAPWRAAPCRVTPCHASLPCHVGPCHTLSSGAMPRHADLGCLRQATEVIPVLPGSSRMLP